MNLPSQPSQFLEMMTSQPAKMESSGDAQRAWPGHMADDVGATYGPVPLATLTFTADGLRVSGNLGDFHVPRPRLKKIGRASLYPWFFMGIRIHHECPGLPASLQFKPLDLSPAQMLQELRQLGLPVA